MATLERAIAIAARAHEGQVDKAGMPYVLHPLRMMLSVATPEARMAAASPITVTKRPSAAWGPCIGPGMLLMRRSRSRQLPRRRHRLGSA